MKSLSVKEINFFFFCMTEFSPLEYSERYKCSPKGKKRLMYTFILKIIPILMICGFKISVLGIV